MDLSYQDGLGNYLSTEAQKGALPVGQNSPQKVPFGLYTEQLSGSAFTELRHQNHHSWLYRIRPSVCHTAFKSMTQPSLFHSPCIATPSPTQMRWDPTPFPHKNMDFLHGLIKMAGNGDLHLRMGGAVYHYAINQSMVDYFYNTDGEYLFVPEQGSLLLTTEFGQLAISPEEIAVIPRGIKFKVSLLEEKARGYLCENYGQPFRLPELGILGANALANPRDFKIPVAHYEETKGPFKLISKFQGQLWEATIETSPCNVVAWHGTYYPYKYDLKKFNTINTVSFDHPDPSIFTVLTSQSNTPHVANIDFVIFPERWMVAEHTFRPPYYHRNIMSEYMGLIKGFYDAKEEGFSPGGASLHNCMSAHGPDQHAYQQAISRKLEPVHYKNVLAFMFESAFVWRPTEFAEKHCQKNYLDCWKI